MCLLLVLCLIPLGDSIARRTHVSPEQHRQLSSIDTVYLSTVLISAEDIETPLVIQNVVAKRLREIGLKVVLDVTEPHDAEIRVTCEAEKKETATTRDGGDAELAFAPDRLWHGAACLLGYRLQGKDLGWYKEVRAASDQWSTTAKVEERRAHLVQQLAEELEQFDFPVFLLSEWGQVERLVVLLRSEQTALQRKQRILEEFRFLPAPDAQALFLDLVEHNKALREFTIGALSGLGSPAIPALRDLFEDATHRDSVRAAAAKGLGHVGLSTGDFQALEPLLLYLQLALKNLRTSTDIEFPVLTEVVWAVGQIHHDETVHLIEDLEAKLWIMYDTSAEMRTLREMVSVVYKYVDLRSRIL